ncbi:ral guanine nucleotide dissociation stimulator-like [Rattus norvegicus]|uniref:ral guanine nucleotide dissociation stimulator-like n=1 Tax=Rattus norvegicus TaxID=10116 RepID=UPI0000507F28|eukprot:XP_017455815.1 PREDICTED: ral guanine nucleotide dissociation stimulator-like [Rattus norvegicus]
MFSCCLRTTRGSGLKKDNRQGLDGVWRHRLQSYLQCLWPFSQRGNNLTKASQGVAHTDLDEKVSAQKSLMEPKALTVVEQMSTLVPALNEGDPLVVLAFLSKYKSSATTLQVLDLLFVRYAYFSPHSQEDEQVKNMLVNFLETWMDKNPEDFCELSDLLPLKYLKGYLSVYMPHCDLSVRVKRLLTQLEEEHAKDSQAKDEEDSDLRRYTSSEPQIEWV